MAERKITDEQIEEVRWLSKKGFLYKEIARVYKVSISTIQQIVDRKGRFSKK